MNKSIQTTALAAGLTMLVGGAFAHDPRTAPTNADFGDPLDIVFGIVGADTVVTEVLVDVRNRWLNRGKFYVDITINGVNAGPHEHGSQLFNVKREATIFEAYEGHSEVVFDYTADTTNRVHSEDYTVCVQPMKWRRKAQVMNIIGEPHCQVFFAPHD